MDGKNVVTILCIYLLSVSCTWIPFNKFKREKNVKLNTVFYSHGVKSYAQCLVKCEEHSSCNAVNYSPDLNICELNNERSTESESQQFDVYYNRYTCEMPWVMFGNDCYMLMLTASDWHTSETRCNQMGANLVDIHSEEENTFVRNIVDSSGRVTSHIWLGMYIEFTGLQTWTTGKQIIYENFKSGEPNSNTENCVEMRYDNKWNDGTCGTTMISVCKRPAQ